MDSRPPHASFEELALPLFDSLFNFAQWLTQNRAEAEDLVQEAYLKALKGFSSFEPGTNFRAWLFRILRNAFLNSRTGLRYTHELSLDSEDEGAGIEPVSPGTPESDLFQHRNREALARAIEGLPLLFREVLILCDVEEMSYAEIAEMLSIPMGTVTSRLTRGRRRLRDALRNEIVWER
jgi:RNA polymerase sigma-70 factor (ECF subfamily)